MSARGLRAQLEQLLALIHEERECAKSLAVDELMAVTRRKEELLQSLEATGEIGPEERVLAETVKNENRRNAYLFWSTLRFIRESVNFFNKQVTQTSYSAYGTVVNSSANGMLLTGRI